MGKEEKRFNTGLQKILNTQNTITLTKKKHKTPLSLTAWWIYNQTTLSQGDYVVVAADMNMMQ